MTFRSEQKLHSVHHASSVPRAEALQYTRRDKMRRGNLTSTSSHEVVREHYRALYEKLGPPHWWPGRTRLEVIVGTYLTQNTSWTNVELALRRLRAAGKLSLADIRSMPRRQLENLIRPAGYFRQKARSLKTFVKFLDTHYDGSLHRMFAQPTPKLRQELLALKGVGPETADSILLYAGQREVFVVDAYARRILERHQLISAECDYEDIRALLEKSLAELEPPRAWSTENTRDPRFRAMAHRPSPMSRAARSPLAQVYNDMHGLLVALGKHYCWKSQPKCHICPLQRFLPSGLPDCGL